MYIDTAGSAVPTPQTTKDPVYGWIDVIKDETYVEYEITITFTSVVEVMKLRYDAAEKCLGKFMEKRMQKKFFNMCDKNKQ